MWTYRAKVIKVIDGDTVDVDIDLGFGIWQKNERVRIMGIDTPESRTRNKIEKKFGLAAKAKLKSLLGKTTVLKTTRLSAIMAQPLYLNISLRGFIFLHFMDIYLWLQLQ